MLAAAFTLSILLGGGLSVQDDNPDGFRGFNPPPITTTPNAPANTLTLFAPGDDSLLTDPAQLMLHWTALPNTKWMQVRVFKPNGQPLFKHRFTDLTALCAEDICRVNLAQFGVTLKDGKRYSWHVVAKVRGQKELVRTRKQQFKAAFSEQTQDVMLPPLYEQDFDPTEPLPFWAMPDNTYDFSINPGYASISTGQILALPYSYVENVDMRARVTINTGGVRLRVRNSGLGGYTAVINVNGQISLYREAVVLGTASITTSVGQTHDFGIIAIGGNITISVDGVAVIAVTESLPLPYGILQITSDFPGETDAHIDDLRIAATIADEPFLGYDVVGDMMRASADLSAPFATITATLDLTGGDRI